jgi:hypothetical protein
MSARKRGAAGGGDGRQVPPGTTTHGAHLSSQEFCSGPPPACAQSKPRRAARRAPTRRDVTKKEARESDQKGQEAAAMTTSSPPMTPPSLRRLPAENLAPGRHRHSQTAAVSSRRGDERTRAEMTSLRLAQLQLEPRAQSGRSTHRGEPLVFVRGANSPGRGNARWRTEACKGLPAPKSNVPLGRRTKGGAPMCRTPPLRRVPRHHRVIRHTDSWPGGRGATEVPLRILRGIALANCTSASYLRLRSAIFSTQRPLCPRFPAASF